MTEKSDSSFIDRIRKSVGRAVNRYGLIGAGDRIAVAVSGGKDSLVMLETLAIRKKHIPIHYDLFAIHVKIDSVPYEIDRAYYEKFCSDLGIPFHYRNVSLDLDDPKKSVCFLCSWTRRKELFTVSSELGCNRLALGHHMDDAVETLLMNMTFNGAISSMPARLSMFGGEIDIIRPLILLTDRELLRYSVIRRYPEQKAVCPYGKNNKRADIKNIVSELQKLNRKAKKNMFSSMSNIHRDYLP